MPVVGVGGSGTIRVMDIQGLGKLLGVVSMPILAIGLALSSRPEPMPRIIGAEIDLLLVGLGLLVATVGGVLVYIGHPRPRLIAAGNTPFHVERVSFGFPADILCMLIVNQQQWPFKATGATRVRAKFTVEGGPGPLPYFHARWTDTTEPPYLPPGEPPPLRVDLDVDGFSQIALVMKIPGKAD